MLSNVTSFENLPCLVLSKIEGRSQDIIFLNDGTRVSLTAFIFGQHLPEFSSIREMQLVQEVCGSLLLRIVRGSDYTADDERALINRLQRSVSGKIKINCEYIDRIEKTKQGKHRFLIQKTEEIHS
jgi:phenylacetate-CoA ligase